MKDMIKRAANIFFTVLFAAALSGCASIIEYWSMEDSAAPQPPDAASVQAGGTGEEAPAVETAVSQDAAAIEAPQTEVDGNAAAQSGGVEPAPQTPSDTAPQTAPAADGQADTPQAAPAASGQAAAPQAAPITSGPAVIPQSAPAAGGQAAAAGETPAAGGQSADQTDALAAALSALAVAQKQAADADAARQKAEADAAAAQKRVADAELAAARKQTADADAARKKAEADAAAAQKRASDTELAAARKQAADADAARKKAEADTAAAQKQAADAENARKKAEADAAIAQKQAADADAARQKAEADAEDMRKSIAVGFYNQPQSAQSAEFSEGIDKILPKYYTVGARPPDCFWEIAKLVYGDPYLWPVLYNANRSKLPDPSNPNLLDVGIVLEIPSINGERREGSYNGG
ncbi:MAG: hypothetical protein LBK66_14705 [Spirochaetaceae bacterium]|jgi:nucleoid-associated protein YgaU|nr:hypothetical protein [Spirochaetaceae bacterium]